MPKRALFTAALIAGLMSSVLLAKEPQAPPAELKQLEPFVGTWKVAEFISKKAVWAPEEVHDQGDVGMTRWIMDGWFLEDRKVPAQGRDRLGIWHYERAEKAFHFTLFQAPGGYRTDLTIRWNHKTKAFEGTAALPNGVTMRTTHRFPDKDTKEWTLKATDAEGKIYLDMSCREVRIAGPASAAPAGAFVNDAAKALQGYWRGQSVDLNGKPAGANVKDVWFTFVGNTLTFRIDGPETECLFKADASKNPKHLDLIATRKTRGLIERKLLPAVYELDGDELRIAIPHGEDRPTEVMGKVGRWLITLKKNKS